MVPKLKRTLYIGLGGTGFKTLLHTKKAFIETYGEVPPMIRFLAIDSDQNEYRNHVLPSIHGDVTFTRSETSDIQVKDAVAKVSVHEPHLTWLPGKNFRAVEDLVNGCGMVRTNGRIAFTFNYEKSRQSIQNALNQLLNINNVKNDKYELLNQAVEVNIVFSIAGGTGSGNFIDMAYLVKDILDSQGLRNDSKIIGYMVLPDVYDAQLTFGKERLFPNAYGSLMDLDYMMHINGTVETTHNYLTQRQRLIGRPFNVVMAISNRNLKGDVVNNIMTLAEMMSMAMVGTAGELSSGISSMTNNLERDMTTGDYDIHNKHAVLGTIGMSEITFRASELSALYHVKAARELAAAMLNPGRDADIAANTWIDLKEIRENNGRDDVINYLISPDTPPAALMAIYNTANPKVDVDGHLNSEGVAVPAKKVQERVEEKKASVQLAQKVEELVNSNGVAFAQEFLSELREQINICLGEMREELATLQGSVSATDSAVNAAIEEYKEANGKFFGKDAAVNSAMEELGAQVMKKAVLTREIQRRNGAITFYTWLMDEIAKQDTKLGNIESSIRSACGILLSDIAKKNSSLMAPSGTFQVDLTQPYVRDVIVNPDDVSINQFVLTLADGKKPYDFDRLPPLDVANLMYEFTQKMSTSNSWGTMTVEDALARLPKDEATRVVEKAISLASPMCPTDFKGETEHFHNYYFIGVQEQSSTGLKGRILNIEDCINSGETSDVNYATIGSRDRIVIYHLYGVFPTYAIAGMDTYRSRHERYMERDTAYSCFFDEDMRIAMEREGFSISPAKPRDNSLELWVKGLIFGLVRRDENGVYQYKDESNDEMVLDDYWTSLGTTYRDEAFRAFKQLAMRLQPQFEEYMRNRARAEGQTAIDAILADAKINYLTKYSQNDLTTAQLKDNLYKGIREQLQNEMTFVKREL